MKRPELSTLIAAFVAISSMSGVLLATPLGDRIESSAKKSYVFTTYLKGDDINIQTSNDSIVTLTGTVSDWSHRTLAEETVAGLKGVKKVDNKLETSNGKPDETTDLWIGMKVKTTLMFHRNVSGMKTDVDVVNGAVTLRGIATSEAQKELTTEETKDVDGVVSVKNNMTIEMPAKSSVEKVEELVDDASITAQAKLALMFHRSTSAIKTKVETKDGFVTVSGVAKNSAEKDLVSKLVKNIKGVKSLKNSMTISKI